MARSRAVCYGPQGGVISSMPLLLRGGLLVTIVKPERIGLLRLSMDSEDRLGSGVM